MATIFLVFAFTHALLKNSYIATALLSIPRRNSYRHTLAKGSTNIFRFEFPLSFNYAHQFSFESRTSKLFSNSNDDEDDESFDSSFSSPFSRANETKKENNESTSEFPSTSANVEEMRLSFEKLIDNDDDKELPMKSDDSSSKILPPTPILTAARRRNLELEIELLSQLDPGDLDKSDNADEQSQLQNQELVISQLWSLWYGERGPNPERELRSIEENLVNQDGPVSWPKAERKYLELIIKHCGAKSESDEKTFSVDFEDIDVNKINLAYWVEPANRLATLLFLMGRLTESKQWCERILREKPWHIGALSGIVLVCIKLNDEAGVRKWALRGLPSLSPEVRGMRRAWVKRNVKRAKDKLSEMEKTTRVAFSGAGKEEISSQSIANTQERQQTPNSIENLSLSGYQQNYSDTTKPTDSGSFSSPETETSDKEDDKAWQ